MENLQRLYETLQSADAVMVGAGAGLSTSAGFTYSGERFEKHFADFIEKYGFTDMYVPAPKPVYDNLLKLVKGKDYFVITTNVDHQFQKAGFDKKRLFYTQGDYGLFQCATLPRFREWSPARQGALLGSRHRRCFGKND